MILYSTPRSHFSRKVRLLLDFYSSPYELIDVGNVAHSELANFGNNPLMTVPVLSDEELWIIESDHIASHLSRKLDKSDQLEVLTNDLTDLNIRAVLNGIMKNEVEIILAKRSEIPIESYDYFKKCFKAILQGLEWIEKNSLKFSPNNPKYRELHFVCAIDHLNYYNTVPLRSFEKIKEIVEIVSTNPFVKNSELGGRLPVPSDLDHQ